MRNVLIIGSGIAGMSAAIACAEQNIHVTLVSPFPSERSQSVMAAGGINAALDLRGEGDSPEAHARDTLAGGCYLENEDTVRALCDSAPDILAYLERLGTVFTLDENGRPAQRAFGGQSFRRTCCCGASTGKQIVSAMVMETRRFEAQGLITRRLWTDFHSGLIEEGRCYGALLYNEATMGLEPFYADDVIIATGGQNALFGKTTGSTQCDGYAAGRLFMQGAHLRNLEFIQYHPTTMETAQKRMLISEAARGEGGRLFYNGSGGERVYFMEDLYGPDGNLMPRDVVSREMYKTGRDIFLDVTHLGQEKIDARIPEVRDLCRKYRGIDIAKEPVPVAPSVHFFMGGLYVDASHRTNIEHLYAAGECASLYHGANRLGGNSLLAAVYGGRKAAESIAGSDFSPVSKDFSDYAAREAAAMADSADTGSRFPVMYIRDLLAETMQRELGIVRDEASLDRGIADISFYLDAAEHIRLDRTVLPYFNYSLRGILTLAQAVLVCAKERRESRGAHFRKDFPQTDAAYAAPTLISYENGDMKVRYDKV